MTIEDRLLVSRLRPLMPKMIARYGQHRIVKHFDVILAVLRAGYEPAVAFEVLTITDPLSHRIVAQRRRHFAEISQDDLRTLTANAAGHVSYKLTRRNAKRQHVVIVDAVQWLDNDGLPIAQFVYEPQARRIRIERIWHTVETVYVKNLVETIDDVTPWEEELEKIFAKEFEAAKQA